MAAEYFQAPGRTITDIDVPLEQWRDQELSHRGLPDHRCLATLLKGAASNLFVPVLVDSLTWIRPDL